MFETIDYTPNDLKTFNIEKIDATLVSKALDVIINTISDNSISHEKY